MQPSRYALAFEPPTELAVFVNVDFIALDAENLCKTNNDRFTTDFGDNKFPYFKGRGSQHSQDQLEEEDEPNEEANQGALEELFTNFGSKLSFRPRFNTVKICLIYVYSF